MTLPPGAILVTQYRASLTPEQQEQQAAIVAQDKARERFYKVFQAYPPSLITGKRLSELFAIERHYKQLTNK